MRASFGERATEDLFHGRQTSRVRKFPNDIHRRVLRKLDMLNAAYRLQDLRSPPGNRLEDLGGDWAGFYSIRVNDKWRIIFLWSGRDAQEVSLIDYHY